MMRVQHERRLIVVGLSILAVACTKVELLTSDPFPPQKPELSCTTSGNCSMDVKVRIASDESCEVTTEYKTVRVAPKETPDMKWSIDDSLDNKKKYDYQFINLPTASPPVHGIEILNNRGGVFTYPDYDGGRKKYKWKNNHQSPMPASPFDYEVNVERSLKGASNWMPCKRIDPRIINE